MGKEIVKSLKLVIKFYALTIKDYYSTTKNSIIKKWWGSPKIETIKKEYIKDD